MPLVPGIIVRGMTAAWEAADAAAKTAGEPNLKFIREGGDAKNMPVSPATIDQAAAAAFGATAGAAIDAYIRSQTLIVPPGQLVVAPPPAGTGSTTSASLPIPVL